MSQPNSRKLMHLIGAVVLTSGLAWFQQSIQGDPPSYDPPRWWNFNGHPLFGVYAWSVMIAAIWSLAFAELVEPTYTAYQRMFEQSMHIIMAGLLAYFISAVGLGSLPWWGFALTVMLSGIAFGILEYRRQSGRMANAFTALVAGFAFGPTAGAVVGIV
ncbi:MAG: hypothetical protein HY976_02375, partial [Candidatus Kerfeldbacteria bacterium]|nr:hypothetical protein [Candidatus Kerfeldbacteria bacterium]